ELLRENSLERAGEFRVLELLTKNTADVKSPSQWVTDIYIPIRTSEPAPTPAPVRVSQPRRPAVSAEPIAEPRDPYPGSTVSPDSTFWLNGSQIANIILEEKVFIQQLLNLDTQAAAFETLLDEYQ